VDLTEVCYNSNNNNNNNYVALVLVRTVPTERPPLVGEVNANFLRIEGCLVVSAAVPNGRILGFLDGSLYYFLQVAPQLYSRGLSGHRSRHTTSQKIW
jgi:hypothetical protein